MQRTSARTPLQAFCFATDGAPQPFSPRGSREVDSLGSDLPDDRHLLRDEFLRGAQASNELDEHKCSHGVFAIPRSEWPASMRDLPRRTV